MSILIFISFITVPDVEEPLNITSLTTENTGNVNTSCYKRSQMTMGIFPFTLIMFPLLLAIFLPDLIMSKTVGFL